MSLIRDNKDALPEDGVRKHKARITVETEPFAVRDDTLDCAVALFRPWTRLTCCEQLTFGPKSQRKRVKLSHPDINALAGDTDASLDKYQSRQEEIRLLNGQAGAAAEDGDAPLDAAVEPIFSKGTSYVFTGPCNLLQRLMILRRRIFNELCKISLRSGFFCVPLANTAQTRSLTALMWF